MNKLKQKIQDGTINIPGIIIKIALIWFIITFLVFPNLNLLARVFVKDGHFTLEAIDKIMKSARAMKSLKNSFVLAIASQLDRWNGNPDFCYGSHATGRKL